MTKVDFLECCAEARPADLGALRLETGWTGTPPKMRPALLLRGSTFGGRTREVVVYSPRPMPGEPTSRTATRLDNEAATVRGWLDEFKRGQVTRNCSRDGGGTT